MGKKTRNVLNYFSGRLASASSKSLLLVFAILVLLLNVSYVLAIVNLVSPPDSAILNTDNDTLAFTFNYTNELTGTVDCNLTLNGVVVGSQASVVVDILAAIYSSEAFIEDANFWNITCSNTTDTNVSETRSFLFDSNPPTAGATTAVNFTYVYGTWLACNRNDINITANFSDTGSGINTSSCEWKDRSGPAQWHNTSTSWSGNSTHGYCIATTSTSTAEQDYNLNLRVWDLAGNLATATIFPGWTDCTAPSTTTNETGGWHSAPYIVNLTCSDGSSGCRNISYNYNSGGWVTGGPGPIEVTIDALGNNTLEYYSTDNVNNTESTKTVYAALNLQCGDTITSDTTLPADLAGCTGNGLNIATAGVTLDCNGHHIQGDYVSSGNEYGVYITANGVTVKNCTIYGYNTTSGVEAGIYATGSSNVLLLNNTLYNNYYGAWVEGGSGSNITGNNVYGSKFQGILVSGAATGFKIMSNIVHDTTSLGVANEAGIAVTGGSASNGLIYGNTLHDLTGASSNLIGGVYTSNINSMNISSNVLYDVNSTGITVQGTPSANNIEDNTITSCFIGGMSIAGTNHNITRNNVSSNTGRGVSLDSNTTRLWHNNIYSNSEYGVYALISIDLYYNNQGNYWGHSTCGSLFTAGVDSNAANVVDSYPYNASNGWTTYGAPPVCSMPGVLLDMPMYPDVRMFSMFNFSVNVTDVQPVTAVAVWNGTAAQPMVMSGADPTNAIWWAVVYLSGFIDGPTSDLVVNATNGYMYNDTEAFDIIVDNTAPSVMPSSPADSFNTSVGSFDAVFIVTDDLATNATCNATLYNASGTPVSTIGNDTTINDTATTLTLSFAAPGIYTWNVTCYDKAGSNVLDTINGNAGSSATRTVTYDVVGPVVDYTALDEPDIMVSGFAPNNVISIEANYTDAGTGVAYVTANFTEIPSANVSIVNMTPDSGLWVVDASVSDTSSYDFEPKNITLIAYDFAGNPQEGGLDIVFETVVLYNMTLMPGDPAGCGEIAAGSTDFSTETDWNHIDLNLLIDLNYSTSCGIPALVADDLLHRSAKFNFTDINLTSEEAFQQLGSFLDSIDVTITPDGQFGNSRIYLNSSAVATFNRTAILTLYGLPFDSMPSLVADPGAAGINETAFTTLYEPYTTVNGTFGNLTFMVNGFSGYNASDTVAPTITVNSPAPNMTTVRGPAPLINFTVNGTGTQVSWVQVYLDGTGYSYNPGDSRYEVTCNATSPGSELYNCNLTAPLGDGSHVLNITAYDYGDDTGNSNYTVWNFSTDSSAPSVTNNQSNVTGIVNSNTVILLNVTVTDSTNVSSVEAGYTTMVPMTNHSATGYNLTTTPAALGCTESGTCTVTFNATDYWNQSNTSVVTSFTVDVGPPSVSGVSVTNATNVSSSTVVNIQATVADPATVADVRANGQSMSLLSGTTTSGTWSGNFNATDLGCSGDATCPITINASDTLGNYNDTETTSYYVDDTNPAVTAPSASPFEVKPASALYIGAVVSDVSNVTSVVSNNSVALTNTGSSWNATTNASALGCAANAVCTIGFTATDMAGNANNTETTTVMVDDTAPVVAFTYNSSSLRRSADTVTLNVTVDEINTNASVTANGHAMTRQGTSNTWSIAGVAVGGAGLGCAISTSACLITFTATDGAGNIGTATTNLQIDNDGPLVINPGVNVTKAKIGDDVMVRVTATDSPAGMTSVSVEGVAMTAMGAGLYEVNDTGTNFGCAANSVCTLTFTALDTLTNANNTVTTNYTTDNLIQAVPNDFTASSLSSSGATVSSSSFTENVICTVNYGTNESLLGTVVAGSISATGAVTLSGLSASTTYYYNVTRCRDEAGNVDTTERGPFNFTTSAASTGGGGGGGGGSYTTTSILELGDLTGGQTEMGLKSGDSMHFTHDAKDHYVKVIRLGEASVDFEVLSEPQSFTLYIGQSKDVNLDGDTRDDVTVKLIDIVYNKALVKVTSLVSGGSKIALLPPAKRTASAAPAEGESPADVGEAAAPAAPETSAAPTATPPAPAETVVNEQKGAWYWYLFGTLIAIIAGVMVALYFVEKKRPGHGL
ncbi:right-handed parallel beta-helix repeat-containing protein [Candidatus Woesearchaeota archaeon]|nr:right-handed parallel beta-helix repeat-containing protein [Candidatus Woesearchaeota archaeon]